MATSRVGKYQELCAATYQAAGVYGFPDRFMDALSDAANGHIEERRLNRNLLPVRTLGLGSVREKVWLALSIARDYEADDGAMSDIVYQLTDALNTLDQMQE